MSWNSPFEWLMTQPVNYIAYSPKNLKKTAVGNAHNLRGQ